MRNLGWRGGFFFAVLKGALCCFHNTRILSREGWCCNSCPSIHNPLAEAKSSGNRRSLLAEARGAPKPLAKSGSNSGHLYKGRATLNLSWVW